MQLTAFVEPHPPGFRAFTGGPLDLTADGPTADAAVHALRQLVTARLAAGGQFVPLAFGPYDEIIERAGKIGDSPGFEDWVQAVEEYRREHNTVPDAD